MVRSFGAASDRVQVFGLVMGDVVIHHVTASTEPELFWGLRGGKGSLGIITGLEFHLLALPQIYAGALCFGASAVAKVLRVWAQWCPTLPYAATTSVALMQLPPMTGVPEPLADTLSRGGAYERCGLMPSSMIGLVHCDPEDSLLATEGSAQLTTFGAEGADALLARAGPDNASPQLMAEIRQLGGVLSNFSPSGGPAGFAANYTAPVLEN